MFYRTTLFGIIAALTLQSTIATADPADARYNATSIGYLLNADNGDFAVGMAVTSPWVFGSSVAVQAAAMQSWYMHGVDADTGDEDWMPFTSYKLGLMGGSLTASGQIRMYGAGGILVVLPNRHVSEKRVHSGGYGAFGLEFLSGRSLNYYIELGANGVGTRADKLAGKPIYGNGFSSTVGLRYYL